MTTAHRMPARRSAAPRQKKAVVVPPGRIVFRVRNGLAEPECSFVIRVFIEPNLDEHIGSIIPSRHRQDQWEFVPSGGFEKNPYQLRPAPKGGFMLVKIVLVQETGTQRGNP